MFTTEDHDNDKKPSENCAKQYHGAWWYSACHSANLNGRYSEKSASGVVWQTWMGHGYPMKKTEMKFRPSGYLN